MRDKISKNRKHKRNSFFGIDGIVVTRLKDYDKIK